MPGCSSDLECPVSQACHNRKCINPCQLQNPCSKLATCRTQNHQPTCQCPVGLTGDPYVECSPCKSVILLIQTNRLEETKILFLVTAGECKSDSECSDSLTCIDQYCQDPCLYPSDPCGRDAQCHSQQHIAICQCPVGWAGDPHKECFKCRKWIFFVSLTLPNTCFASS